MPLFGKKKSQEEKPISRNGLARKKTVGSFAKSEPYVERLVWLGLKAADVMVESIFLENNLQLAFSDEGNSSAGHHIRYNCGAIELELVEGGATWASRPKPKNGTPEMPLVASFELDNIASMIEILNQKEVPATQLFDQGWTVSALFLDPEHNIWQVEEIRTLPPAGTTQIGKIGSIWLECQDLEQQVTFYRDVLRLPLISEGGGKRPITAQTEYYRRQPEQNRPALTASQPPPTPVEATVTTNSPEEATQTEVSTAADNSQTVHSNSTQDSVAGTGLENTPEVAANSVTSTDSASSEPLNLFDTNYQVLTAEGPILLAIETPEELEDSLVGVHPRTAIFFANGTHLVLTGGGSKRPHKTSRVWGSDVSFTLSFRTVDVKGLAQKLRVAGYAVTAPAPDTDSRRGLAFTFTDPEGNVWQAAEWLRLPT